MGLPLVRFTVRRLMLLVAAIAVGLALWGSSARGFRPGLSSGAFQLGSLGSGPG